MMPQDYEEWKDCIVNKCKIPLTRSFIEKRIEALSDASNAETAKFTKLYGEHHLSNVLGWLEQGLEEVDS